MPVGEPLLATIPFRVLGFGIWEVGMKRISGSGFGDLEGLALGISNFVLNLGSGAHSFARTVRATVSAWTSVLLISGTQRHTSC